MRWIDAAALTVLLCLGADRSSYAQVPFHREVVAIDPAHGGSDTGARIDDKLFEKDVTLAIAGRLRSLLAARGFTVVSTRQDDTSAGPTDQRADAANKAHAVACLVVHASASGNGMYIGSSAIGSPIASVPEGSPGGAASGIVPWNRAQEAWVPQSLRLANLIGLAVTRSSIPVAMGRVALPPLDNLMCPAISIEVRPLHVGASDGTPLSDERYQQRVADAIAGALVFWRNQAQQPEYVGVPRPTAELFWPTQVDPDTMPVAAGSGH